MMEIFFMRTLNLNTLKLLIKAPAMGIFSAMLFAFQAYSATPTSDCSIYESDAVYPNTVKHLTGGRFREVREFESLAEKVFEFQKGIIKNLSDPNSKDLFPKYGKDPEFIIVRDVYLAAAAAIGDESGATLGDCDVDEKTANELKLLRDSAVPVMENDGKILTLLENKNRK
jgi:hypothetical protein